MATERYIKTIELLTYCLKDGATLKQACQHLGLGEGFPRRSRTRLAEALVAGRITKDEFELFTKLYNQVTLRKAVGATKPVGLAKEIMSKTSLVSTVDLDNDERFDERSKGWEVRDEKGQIISYAYKILVRDELPFTGSLTRDQMEKIYSEYPYTTLNNVSADFPYLTVQDLKRIMRTFNITKDRLFPPHIVEEHTEDEIADFALKAKEKSSFKKFAAQKLPFIESKLRDTQAELKKALDTQEWADTLVQKYLNTRTIASVSRAVQKFNLVGATNKPLLGTTFGIISDIHVGKNFPTKNMAYGRGTDKIILRERCLEAADIILEQSRNNNSDKLHILCLGDVLESMQPDGQHAQHTEEMDLIGDRQVLYAVDLLEEFFDVLAQNFSGSSITFSNIGGNHDRNSKLNNEDRKRTGALLVYKMLGKVLKLKYNGLIQVNIYEDGIMRFEDDGLSFIATHGDSPVSKKPAIDLINLFKVGDSKNYTVILKGHLHHSKQIDEGPNFVYLQAGALCSADGFTQNTLGLGAQPSILTINKGKHYGVDYKKSVLY